jgi:hypothetical protein
MKALLTHLSVLVLCMASAQAITYPYEAPVERQRLIRTQWTAIKPGMSSKNVIAILDKPDEIAPLYEPKVKNPRMIGSTMWYIVSQRKEHGSANEIQRVALAIRFDLKGNVTRIDRIKL